MPDEPASEELTAAIDQARIVIGTTRASFRAFVADPPPWEQAHLTALAWVVDPEGRSILLVDHRVHGWSCAGGHVEPGEHPAATAARELREETGIVATPPAGPLVVGSAVGCAQVPGARHWTLGYRFVVDAAIDIRTEPGQPAAWFPFDELPSPRAADIERVLASVAV